MKYFQCEMRASHASAKFKDDAPPITKSVKKEKWSQHTMVKGRNESTTIVQVAHVVAKVKGISINEVCEAAWANSIRMFGFGEALEQQEH
jgi:TatD DNase family protein